MRTSNINKLSTIIVFCILESTIFWHSQCVGYGNLKITVYVLLVLLTSGLMINLIAAEKHKRITSSVLHAVIIIIIVGCGSLSAILVGSQTHFEKDGAMRGFGLPMWRIILGIIYPVTFSLFIIFLGLVKKWIIQITFLTLWLLATIVIAYFLDNRSDINDSFYFPSETEIITPILLITTGFWTAYILFRNIRIKTPFRSATQ